MGQLTPIKGFLNTPITRSIFIISTVGALLISVFGLKQFLVVSLKPGIFDYNQYWRIAIGPLFVINESDYMLSAFLWFHNKGLERFFGSRKYLSLIMIFYFYNMVFCFLLMISGAFLVRALRTLVYLKLFHGKPSTSDINTIFNEIIPGPIGILSSLYVCYGTYIPVSYVFRILLAKPKRNQNDEQSQGDDTRTDPSSSVPSLQLTNHFHLNVIYTMMLLNNGMKSIIPSIVGLIIGKMYCLDLLTGAKTWLIPTYVHYFMVDPMKLCRHTAHMLGQFFHGNYDPLSPNMDNDLVPEEETDDILDDNRSQVDREIRAETPVRPLRNQFFDIFRT